MESLTYESLAWKVDRLIMNISGFATLSGLAVILILIILLVVIQSKIAKRALVILSYIAYFPTIIFSVKWFTSIINGLCGTPASTHSFIYFIWFVSLSTGSVYIKKKLKDTLYLRFLVHACLPLFVGFFANYYVSFGVHSCTLGGFMKALLGIFGIALFWIAPLFIVSIITNYAFTKVLKIDVSKKYHAINSLILALWPIVFTCAFIGMISNTTHLFIAFLATSPIMGAIQANYIKTSNTKRIIIVLVNAIFLFIADDFITTYFFVLPMHRSYFLFDILGI